jgi:hypothetical protein
MLAKEEVASVLDALFTGFQSESVATFEHIKHLKPIEYACNAVEETDADLFYMSLIYPLGNMVDGLLTTYFGQNYEVQFLFKHYSYVESHFRHNLERHEGSACVADKTRTIIRHLIIGLTAKTKLEFDYSGEYTFHLPKKVFMTQDQNIEFFKGIYDLYYGNPIKYLTAMQKMEGVIKS